MHTSTPGRVILIEPGAVHDGHAPEQGGFTYSMLYLPQRWLHHAMRRSGHTGISAILPAFRHTLTDDMPLSTAIQQAFIAVHHAEGRLARDQSLDRMIGLLCGHLAVQASPAGRSSTTQMDRARDYLHDQMCRDIGLEDLARHAGTDRFRLTRQFRVAFGMSPHAYLVRLRLRRARALLAQGVSPAQAATDVGFADQSHLGRWFRRAYRLTPAAYQRQCSNVLD